MLSVLPERPVQADIVAILTLLGAAAQAEDIDYFLVGATARDILLTHVFGMETGRATRDVDLAIAISEWAQFERLKQRLAATGRFATSAEIASRLYFDPDASGIGYPLDLIPFGGVEDPARRIAWPPDMAVVMNVAGYAEARAAALAVEVAPGLVAAVVSLPGLAMLKLFAWQDRGMASSKDAQDLYFLMRSYAHAGNTDRLYAEAFHVLEACDYDPDRAGAVLLGSDAAKLISVTTRAALLRLLHDAQQVDRLALHMASGQRALQDTGGTAAVLLSAFTQGFDQIA